MTNGSFEKHSVIVSVIEVILIITFIVCAEVIVEANIHCRTDEFI